MSETVLYWTSSSTSSHNSSDDEQFYDAIATECDHTRHKVCAQISHNKVNDSNIKNDESINALETTSSSASSMSRFETINDTKTDDIVVSNAHNIIGECEPQSKCDVKLSTQQRNNACKQQTQTQSQCEPQPQQPLLPRPPPRKKRFANSLSIEENTKNSELSDISAALMAANIQDKNLLNSSTNVMSVASNLTSFLDDIASIKGDLSVNEAILSHIGDRRSVYVDECTKPYQDIISKIDETNSLIVQMPNKPIEPLEQEILNTIMITNMDTGEMIPLSKADDILPKCLNPLSLHLMKLTNDYPDNESNITPESAANYNNENFIREHDFDDEDDDEKDGTESRKDKFKKGMKNLRKIGTGIMKGVKGVKTVKERSTFHVELKHPGIEPEIQPRFKLKVNHKRGTPDFEGLRLLQELYDCKGAIWCLKFSVCGQLLAAAGQDHFLRVYCCQKAWKYFTQLRNKASGQQVSPSSTKERDGSFGNRSFTSQRSGSLSSADNLKLESSSSSLANYLLQEDNTLSEEGPMLLFSAYRGHTADVLDIAWSKNHFLLSSSMDKTVRLWHITRIECLCTFRHIDFVTTIQFHPRDDRYFLSGSLDGKLRLWNIPDKRVTLWNEVMALPTHQSRSNSNKESITPHGLITSSSFVQNGKFAVIGTYDGRIIFYSTDQLKYFTQIHVCGKSISSQNASVSANSNRRRRRINNKVTGIEGVDDNKILVTTNDSRVRLYDLRDLSLTCKYRGCLNESSQIKASVSHDNKYIICGSENASFYIWRLQDNTTIGQRRDRNKQYECVRLLPPQTTHITPDVQQSSQTALPATTKIVTSAIFAAVPSQIDDSAKYVIAVADFNGNIRIFCK